MTIDDVLQKLAKTKKSANGWIALCPSHDDKQRSLSITAKDGKVLVNCFAGCRVEQIVARIGLHLSDLFESNPNGFNNPAPPRPRTIRAIYEYADEHGEILYENVRYEPKGFQQRRPDGRGGYIWKLNRVNRVPYRLPELIQATQTDDVEVCLCEGEKDADNLRLLGFTASSFKNWQPSFNQYVKAAHVVLFQDHDTPGATQAADAANILTGECLSVKVIDLFQGEPLAAKNGKDVTDYIDACQTDGQTNDEIAERLCEIVEGAQTWTADQAGQTATASFQSAFRLKTANEWIMEAKLRPMPKMLFDEFWFENELCILFADTGKGKSILAVQTGESNASGRAISGFTQTAKAQKVLYFDFELSDKQFESRYAAKSLTTDFHENHYRFSPNLFRAEIDPDAPHPQSFETLEDYMSFSIEHHLAETDAKILIVDNLTYLRRETERAKDALPLMKDLKRLKTKYGLSILALAHTPKRDLSRPITINDLGGSKMLSNFADTVFAIGESQKDHRVRYLKQIKTRNAETKYHSENVCVCQLEKTADNFLQFQFLGYGKESEHLLEVTQKDRDAEIQKINDLHLQGKTQREIANELGCSVGKVNKILNAPKANTAKP